MLRSLASLICMTLSLGAFAVPPLRSDAQASERLFKEVSCVPSALDSLSNTATVRGWLDLVRIGESKIYLATGQLEVSLQDEAGEYVMQAAQLDMNGLYDSDSLQDREYAQLNLGGEPGIIDMNLKFSRRFGPSVVVLQETQVFKTNCAN